MPIRSNHSHYLRKLRILLYILLGKISYLTPKFYIIYINRLYIINTDEESEQ